ncbi:MAG TPA: pyridoxal-phosphate dependent enzyme [Chloroflexia bacterium]|nr:pyridoxal-phosphate dependent enzyme [Chloroflexia bacterium]
MDDLDPQAVSAAAAALDGVVRRTPVLDWGATGGWTPPSGARLVLKLEHLQLTGSFKVRGAWNLINALPEAERALGLVTASGGNHGLAVAWAAARAGVPATVFLPRLTPPAQAAKIESFGATVHRHGEAWDDAWEAAVAYATPRGLPLVHPFDDPRIVAGQGTVGLELLEQVPEMDLLIVAVGGGGLLAGIAATVKQRRPDVTIIGVEPTGAASMSAALAAAAPVALPGVHTIAHTLAPRRVSQLTLDLCRRYVDAVVLVQDAQIVEAMRLLWTAANLLVEPSGAATLAALLAGRVPATRTARQIVAVVCGANVDAEPAIALAVAHPSPRDGKSEGE